MSYTAVSHTAVSLLLCSHTAVSLLLLLQAAAVLRQYKHLLEQSEEVSGRLAEAKLIKTQRWGAPHGTALHHSELQLHKLSADKVCVYKL